MEPETPPSNEESGGGTTPASGVPSQRRQERERRREKLRRSEDARAPREIPRPDGKGERTRQNILEAARACFARVGFERATIRMIATEAGADKSSVTQYFGSKHQLFREAVYFDIPISEATSPTTGQTVENYLRGMFARWEVSPDSPEAVLTRTSMTSEEAADMLRLHIEELSVKPIASTMPGDPDADLRAAIFSMMMMGLASGRYLLDLPIVADARIDDLVRITGPALSLLLSPQHQDNNPAPE
jgi:AcrR family transcriptional regulator